MLLVNIWVRWVPHHLLNRFVNPRNWFRLNRNSILNYCVINYNIGQRVNILVSDVNLTAIFVGQIHSLSEHVSQIDTIVATNGDPSKLRLSPFTNTSKTPFLVITWIVILDSNFGSVFAWCKRFWVAHSIVVKTTILWNSGPTLGLDIRAVVESLNGVSLVLFLSKTKTREIVDNLTIVVLGPAHISIVYAIFRDYPSFVFKISRNQTFQTSNVLNSARCMDFLLRSPHVEIITITFTSTIGTSTLVSQTLLSTNVPNCKTILCVS